MGLFDTVIIEKLKLDYPEEIKSFLEARGVAFPTEFQTKELECYMGLYKIDEEGQLWVQNRKPTGKRIPLQPLHAFWKDSQSLLERIYWKSRDYSYSLLNEKEDSDGLTDEYEHVWEKDNSTVTAFLYAYDLIKDKYLTLDYECIFVGGKLVSSHLKEWEIESDKDAEERLQRDKEYDIKWKKHSEERKKLTSSWYYPLIKEVYNPFAFFTKLALGKISNILIHLSYKISKY